MAATSLCRQLHGSVNGALIFQHRAANAATDIKTTIVFRANIVRVLTKGLAEVNRVRARERVNRAFRHLHLVAAQISLLALALAAVVIPLPTQSQELPSLINVVDYTKLLPLLPEAPAGWTADKAEGSTTDAGGFKLTNVHRDYRKGEGDNAPTTSISILDSAANPDYVEATTAAWSFSTSSTEGYSKSVTLDGNQGFETFENEGKHGTLWLMVAKRYFVQIETKDQNSAALQEWAKRVDLKKLAEIK